MDKINEETFYMRNDESESEDGDSVVEEYDVLLSDQLEDELFLLQFPLRPCYRPDVVPSSAQIRPERKILELSYHLDEKDAHYDSEKLDELLLKERTLRSTHIPNTHGTYAVGVLRDDGTNKEFHITPFSSVVKMRPDFSHLDRVEKETIITDPAPKKDKPEGVKPQLVEVFQQHRETERMHNIRKNSYAYLKQQEQEDQWVELNVTEDVDDTTFERQFAKLLHKQRDMVLAEDSPVAEFDSDDQMKVDSEALAKKRALKKTMTFGMSPADYINAIAPPAANMRDSDKHTPTLSESLKNAPLHTQLVETFKQHHLLRFDMLRQLTQAPDNLLLQALQQLGVCIQGLWTAKSEVFYPVADSLTMSTQATLAARRCAIRDIVMAQFHKSNSKLISRLHITNLIKVSPLHLREAFTSIARMTPSKMWELKQEPDNLFATQYPQIVKQQARMWEKREAEAMSKLQRAGGQHGHSSSSLGNGNNGRSHGHDGDLPGKLSSKETSLFEEAVRKIRAVPQANVAATIEGLTGTQAATVLKVVFRVQGTSKLKAGQARQLLAKKCAESPEQLASYATTV